MLLTLPDAIWRRIRALIALTAVPSGGTTGQVVTKTATGYGWKTNAASGDAFGIVAVSGQSNVVADGAGDTLTLVAGTNVTLTTSAAGDSVTIAASGGGGNAFGTVAVAGQSDVVADASADTITLVGSGLTITTDAGTDTITFTVTGGSGLTQPQVMARSMGC